MGESQYHIEQERIDRMFSGVDHVDAWMVEAVRVAQAELNAAKAQEVRP